MVPQLIYMCLALIGLGMEFSKHGEPKKGKHNGWFSLIGLLIAMSVLYYGGFFNPLLK